VKGLLAKPELNGAIVELGTFHVDKGRYAVHGISNNTEERTGISIDTAAISAGENAAAANTAAPTTSPAETTTPTAAFRGLLKPDNLVPLPPDWPPESTWALVDTGAERSALAPSEAERYFLPS